MSKPLRKRDQRVDVLLTPDQLTAAMTGAAGVRVQQRKDGSFRLSGVTPDLFMSPQQPITPQAQSIAGRLWDYPVGLNLNYTPRSYEPVSFIQLRQLADSWDLMRLAIETRKDQLCKLDWQIVNKDKKARFNEDARIQTLTAFFERPDRVNSWQTWLRVLMEEVLVTDAATIYPRMTNGGKLYALEPLDGTRIKPVIDEFGRQPAAPQPAYQQVIKGLPAVDYTADELMYIPRNKRVWKLYGMSPVEQVIMTVNIALRRQIHQLQFYTEGNIPEALVSVPETWTPSQIKDMQNIWDALMEGNTAQRRHMKFIPGKQNVTFTKEAALKDEYDEWLARIVCYAFSLPPTAFVKQMNRATAESAQEAALEEGLAPLMTWVADQVNYTIVKYFGITDLEFRWKEEEDLDPKDQADINKTYIDAGVLDAEEVRNDLGREPRKQPAPGAAPGSPLVGAEDADAAASGASAGAAPGAATQVQDTAMNGTQVTALLAVVDEVAGKNLPPETATAIIQAAFPLVKPEIIAAMLDPLKTFEKPTPPPPVVVPGSPGAPGAAAGATPQKGAKSPKPSTGAPGNAQTAKQPAPVGKAASKLDRKAGALGKRIARALTAVKRDVVKQVVDGLSLGKAKTTSVIAQLDFSAMSTIYDDLLEAQSDVAIDASATALGQVGQDSDRLVKLANTRAERWAAQNAADLIKSDASGGELIDATRNMIRDTVLKAEEGGWSSSQLADALESDYAFSAARADTIARTELKNAEVAGSMVGYRTSGVVKAKTWSTSEDDVCDECQDNEAAGEVDLNEDFPSGDDAPPAHPNCNCSVSPVLSDEFTNDGD